MQNRGSRRVIREPLLLVRECVARGRERQGKRRFVWRLHECGDGAHDGVGGGARLGSVLDL